MIFSVLSDRSENENITAIIVIVMISMIILHFTPNNNNLPANVEDLKII